jgi:polyisoprenoid-binding protein YceI
MSSRPWIRRRTRWLVGGLAVLVLLVVGGPFVYIHFIEGKAPKKLSLATTTGPTPASPAGINGPVTGTWNATSASQLGYRVQEVLFGQSNTAVGRTNAVTGHITIEGTTVTSASFSVDMTKVTSDQSRRDNSFENRIMDVSTYPTASFVLSQPIELGSIPPAGTTVAPRATGNLTLRGTTRPVAIDLSARRTGNMIEVNGSLPIKFSDWNIPNPSFGPVTTQDHGTLEFLLVFAHT